MGGLGPWEDLGYMYMLMNTESQKYIHGNRPACKQYFFQIACRAIPLNMFMLYPKQKQAI